jgi:Kef-type K+ transport system membrane component KefB
MESLANFVGFLLLALLLLALATLVFSLLARLGKVPPVVGYVALGFQVAETAFAYLITEPIGNASLTIAAGCALLLFTPGSKVLKRNFK